MAGDNSAQLITTPPDPPLPSSVAFKIEGKLSDDGSLEAKIEDTVRGEPEVAVRSAFRRVSQSQWKELVQQISYIIGFAGTVSDVDASRPEALTEPFHFSYSYNRKDYPDWSNHQFTVPGLPFFMPPAKDDAKDPVWLGPPQETVSDSKFELPQGYAPQLPSNVDLKYDFAEYHASYSRDQGTLVSKRRLLTKLREVPVAELDDYRSFLKKLQNDLNQYVQTSSSNLPAVPNLQFPGMSPSFLSAMRELPESISSEANRLEADGRTAVTLGDRSSAIASVKHALELDPKFTRAWLEIGTMYLASRQVDSALDAFRNAIDADPKQLVARKTYAFVLAGLRRPEAAMDAWRGVLEIAPADAEANSGMGASLLQQKRYSEAVPYMEAAAKVDNSPAAQNRLGSAYLQAGQIEKATAALEKVAVTDPSPAVLNDISYQLADANASLPKALEWAQRAVDEQEKRSREVKLSNLLSDDPRYTLELGYYWDTLGWAHFRLGHLDQAESYLNAAWVLSQMSVPADHLGQVYEQEKQTAKAIQMYGLALAAPTPETQMIGDDLTETRKRFDRLNSAAKPPTAMDRLRDPNSMNLSHMRLVKLPESCPGEVLPSSSCFSLPVLNSKMPDSSAARRASKVRAQCLRPQNFRSHSPKAVRRAS